MGPGVGEPSWLAARMGLGSLSHGKLEKTGIGSSPSSSEQKVGGQP